MSLKTCSPSSFYLFFRFEFFGYDSWDKSGFWYAGSEFPVPEIPSTMYTHTFTLPFIYQHYKFELYISHSDEPYISTFYETVKQNNPSVITLLSILGGRNESTNFRDD
ncbi:hypothetical protein HAX54_014009 [Datura stramonium]|uniref:Uncharacterized protein n=1 Tax=Datura stramonium TaxID=4076 RepID=A0ABS8Y5R6_DATST|nr:hypothetical protein [Datura stramonium]